MFHTSSFCQHSMFSETKTQSTDDGKLKNLFLKLLRSSTLSVLLFQNQFQTLLFLQKLPIGRIWYEVFCSKSSEINFNHLTKTPRSACAAPPIIFGTKLLWPGASNNVNFLLSVSNWARPTSTVLPWIMQISEKR